MPVDLLAQTNLAYVHTKEGLSQWKLRIPVGSLFYDRGQSCRTPGFDPAAHHITHLSPCNCCVELHLQEQLDQTVDENEQTTYAHTGYIIDSFGILHDWLIFKSLRQRTCTLYSLPLLYLDRPRPNSAEFPPPPTLSRQETSCLTDHTTRPANTNKGSRLKASVR